MPGATDLVVDASALIGVAVDDERTASIASTLSGRICHAPHLVDAEVAQGLRGMQLRGEIDAVGADESRQIATGLVRRRHVHQGALIERAWQLRSNVSVYDGLYVALAERLGAPLVTLDGRLARAVGDLCAVEVPT